MTHYTGCRAVPYLFMYQIVIKTKERRNDSLQLCVFDVV